MATSNIIALQEGQSTHDSPMRSNDSMASCSYRLIGQSPSGWHPAISKQIGSYTLMSNPKGMIPFATRCPQNTGSLRICFNRGFSVCPGGLAYSRTLSIHTSSHRQVSTSRSKSGGTLRRVHGRRSEPRRLVSPLVQASNARRSIVRVNSSVQLFRRGTLVREELVHLKR